jgi:malate dehydrogenase (oxaloacetate-decarboxylating)
VFNNKVVERVRQAVIEAAYRTGVARKDNIPLGGYMGEQK